MLAQRRAGHSLWRSSRKRIPYRSSRSRTRSFLRSSVSRRSSGASGLGTRRQFPEKKGASLFSTGRSLRPARSRGLLWLSTAVPGSLNLFMTAWRSARKYHWSPCPAILHPRDVWRSPSPRYSTSGARPKNRNGLQRRETGHRSALLVSEIGRHPPVGFLRCPSRLFLPLVLQQVEIRFKAEGHSMAFTAHPQRLLLLHEGIEPGRIVRMEPGRKDLRLPGSCLCRVTEQLFDQVEETVDLLFRPCNPLVVGKKKRQPFDPQWLKGGRGFILPSLRRISKFSLSQISSGAPSVTRCPCRTF